MIAIQHFPLHLRIMQIGTLFLLSTLTACQQAASNTTLTPSSQQPPIESVPASESTQAPSATVAGNWKLSVSPGEDGTYRIHVAGSDGKELQVIDGQEGKAPYEAAALLKLEDFTGDGKPDILARGLSAGASALTSESIYVYDSKSGRFLDAEFFENDGEVTKTGPGCIEVKHRNPDNMTYSNDQYCWKDKWIFKGSKN